MRVERLWLITGAGQEQPIEVEVAADLAEKRVGLMFRTYLADGKGMLFPYETPQEVTMWMRNTYIPLDMVFIRADGVVHRIEKRAEPMSERIIASEGPVTAVLELAGGAADRLGLKAGDHVRHRHFSPSAP
ncbi:MAG: DUF192 domain-containing protein [Hyphomicrobium sp.]